MKSDVIKKLMEGSFPDFMEGFCTDPSDPEHRLRAITVAACQMLQINIPKIVMLDPGQVEELFDDKDIMAAYDPEYNQIIMTRKDHYGEEDYYILFHEIRHAWQKKNWIKDQFCREKDSSYHGSDAEIDANAFASAAMQVFLKCDISRIYYDHPDIQEIYENKSAELIKIYSNMFEA